MGFPEYWCDWKEEFVLNMAENWIPKTIHHLPKSSPIYKSLKHIILQVYPPYIYAETVTTAFSHFQTPW